MLIKSHKIVTSHKSLNLLGGAISASIFLISVKYSAMATGQSHIRNRSKCSEFQAGIMSFRFKAALLANPTMRHLAKRLLYVPYCKMPWRHIKTTHHLHAAITDIDISESRARRVCVRGRDWVNRRTDHECKRGRAWMADAAVERK